MNVKKSIIVFVAAFTFLNCLGTEVGNPPEKTADIKIDFVVPTPDIADIGNISVNEDIVIDEAIIVVSSLRFRKCDLGENQAFKSESFLAELLKEKFVDSSVNIEPGDYCRLDIQPLRGGEDGKFSERPELKGYTLYVKGTYQDVPLFIRYEGDDEISFLGEFSIDTKSDRLFIAVDLKKWFEGVDLALAEKVEDEIILGGEINSDLLEKLSENFESSIQVAVDQNNNGVLDRIELRGEDEEDE